MLTYLLPGRYSPAYGEFVRDALPRAHWANGNFWDDSYRRLSRSEVADCYKQARVGLVLSAVEGPNLASIQCLLADIPVVSTPSTGGRDVFYSEGCAAVVPPEPAAIAAAVSRFQHERPPALEIRRRTLAKIQGFRDRFGEILVARCGHAPVNEAWWREFTTHRPMAYQNLTKVADLLRSHS